MLFLRKMFLLIILIMAIHKHCFAQEDGYKYDYDTARKNVFNGADNYSFKLDYYHTEGYSSRDRYWYEVMVLDSLVILNFQSPKNESWNYISYQKRMVISDSTLSAFKSSIKTFGIKQVKKGIPKPDGTGYGADNLFIESPDVHIAGGTVFMAIGNDTDGNAYKARIGKEKQQSSSIAGDYENFFRQLERIFMNLPILLKDSKIEQ
jgi:hypothetical protein